MVQLVISDRYHSREGLLKFLKERFGAHVNFNIIETDDGHFKFEAPENLTEKEWNSLHQKDTWAPVNVSSDMIVLLMEQYSLSVGFLHLLSCFRDRHLPTEEGFTGSSRLVETADKVEFGWIYKYAEEKKVKRGNPWRIRHTGIYHVHNRITAQSTIFIISPSPAAQFKCHLQKALQQTAVRSTVLANPMLVHSILVSTHLYSWKSYLKYHETLLLELDTKSACTSFEQPYVSFNTLKQVRTVERGLLPLEPLLTSFVEVTVDLQSLCSVFQDTDRKNDVSIAAVHSAVCDFRKEAQSYKTQSLYLHKRCQSTAQSVLDSLNLGHQQLAQSQSRNTLVMARSAREDSVAIRAITLVTSLYLPFSFVATMFGMNLVDFDSHSHDLLVSNQFWLYFVISIPLTVATLVCWRWKMHSYRKANPTGDTKNVHCIKTLDLASDIEMV
ncbi:unnamed protein product [Alternaria alternata]